MEGRDPKLSGPQRSRGNDRPRRTPFDPSLPAAAAQPQAQPQASAQASAPPQVQPILSLDAVICALHAFIFLYFSVSPSSYPLFPSLSHTISFCLLHFFVCAHKHLSFHVVCFSVLSLRVPFVDFVFTWTRAGQSHAHDAALPTEAT